jgi:hypothetical protein
MLLKVFFYGLVYFPKLIFYKCLIILWIGNGGAGPVDHVLLQLLAVFLSSFRLFSN